MALPRQHPCAAVGGESVAPQPHRTSFLYDADLSFSPLCNTKAHPEENREE